MSRPASAYYRAAAVTRAVLQSILDTIGGANVSNARLTPPRSSLTTDEAAFLIEAIRSTDEASLFPAGAHQLAALRFVVEDEGRLPVTLLFITGYDRPAPLLVDGHIFDRSRAVEAWLGESDPSDHPELKLVQ